MRQRFKSFITRLFIGLFIVLSAFLVLSCAPPAEPRGQPYKTGKYDLTTMQGIQNALADMEYIQSMAGALAAVGMAPDFLYGDVNQDGAVTIVDCLLTAQYYAGMNPPAFVQPAAADVDDNGVIDIDDAILIAQFYVGEISVFKAQSNIFRNGHFHAGANDWGFYLLDSAQASTEITNGECRVSTTNGGQFIWSIGITQINFDLEAGNNYTLSFKARTTTPNPASLRTVFQLQQEPWFAYLDRTFALTQNMTTYSATFMMKTSDPQSGFNFHFGNPNGAADFYIDDVCLYKTASPKEYVRAQGRRLVVGAADNPVRLHGVGFGNQFWPNPTLPPTTHHSELDFMRCKNMNMNSIRFCLNYALFEDDANPYVYKQTGWDWLGQNIEWAKKYGVYLVLDIHTPQGGYQSDGDGEALWTDPANQERFIALWKAIADYCAAETIVAGFDLLNEPKPTSGVWQWNELASRTISAIRQVDVNHLIIMTVENEPLNDINIAYTFHCYWPGNYTHQYTPWALPGFDGGAYPDETLIEVEGEPTLYRNKEYLRSRLDFYEQWGAANNVPLYCGEFGLFYVCFENDKGGLTWVNDVIDLFQEYDISYSYWVYHEAYFGIYQNDEGLPDPSRANQGLIDLLTRKN